MRISIYWKIFPLALLGMLILYFAIPLPNLWIPHPIALTFGFCSMELALAWRRMEKEGFLEEEP